MKIKLLLIAIIFFCPIIYADYIFSENEINATYVNSIDRWDRLNIQVYYDDKTYSPVLIIKETLYEYRLILQERTGDKLQSKPEYNDSYNKFIEYLNKYLEWEKIAVEKKAKTQKMIGTTCPIIYYKLGDELHEAKYNPFVYMQFFSQSETRHQLLISFGNFMASPYDSFKPKELYLEKTDVEKLLNCIKAEKAKQFVDAYNEKEKKDNEIFK